MISDMSGIDRGEKDWRNEKDSRCPNTLLPDREGKKKLKTGEKGEKIHTYNDVNGHVSKNHIVQVLIPGNYWSNSCLFFSFFFLSYNPSL